MHKSLISHETCARLHLSDDSPALMCAWQICLACLCVRTVKLMQKLSQSNHNGDLVDAVSALLPPPHYPASALLSSTACRNVLSSEKTRGAGGLENLSRHNAKQLTAKKGEASASAVSCDDADREATKPSTISQMPPPTTRINAVLRPRKPLARMVAQVTPRREPTETASSHAVTSSDRPTKHATWAGAQQVG